eukprot:3931343-Amphidinium_carterae.1
MNYTGLKFGRLRVDPPPTIFEANLRAELLERLQGVIRQECFVQHALTTPEILMIMFRIVVPVQNTARIEAAKRLEQPLSPASSFQQALDQLRSWVKTLGTSISQMGVNPDPDRLFSSFFPLVETLLKQDPMFAGDVG